MSRVLRLTRRYLRNADRLGVIAGSARGRAVGRTIQALGGDGELPAPGDVEALVPPTGIAYVRRVPGRNLWLWYILSGEDGVILIALTADPPVPLSD